MKNEINKELFFKSCLEMYKKTTPKNKHDSNYEQYLIERSDSDDDLHVQSFIAYRNYLSSIKDFKPTITVVKMKPLNELHNVKENKIKKVIFSIYCIGANVLRYSKNKINAFYNL